jgi:hypothetical protein
MNALNEGLYVERIPKLLDLATTADLALGPKVSRAIRMDGCSQCRTGALNGTQSDSRVGRQP